MILLFPCFLESSTDENILVLDFRRQCSDAVPKTFQYWHFLSTFIAIRKLEIPYKMSITHNIRNISCALGMF